MEFSVYILKKFSVKKGTLPLRWVSSPGLFDCRSVKKVVWNFRSTDDRAFDRQSKGPGFDTQRSESVPFFTKTFFKIYIVNPI